MHSFRYRARDEERRDSDAQLTRQELVQDEAFAIGQRAPPLDDRGLLLFDGSRAQRQQPPINPIGKRDVGSGGGGRGVLHEERDGLCHIADGGDGFFNEPRGQRGRVDEPAVQQRRTDEALEAPAGENVRRPRGIGRRCRAKIPHHRRDLHAGRGRGVELLEEFTERLHLSFDSVAAALCGCRGQSGRRAAN